MCRAVLLGYLARDDLLELFQLDEQGDCYELALHFGSQGKLEVTFACGCVLGIGSRSMGKRITRTRICLDVADNGSGRLDLLRHALQRLDERLERHARISVRVDGR